MKILVCGSRTYDDYNMVRDILKRFPIKCLISGGAKGADSLAEQYALECGIEHFKKYPANWALYGKKAGPIRNQLMLDDNPDIDEVIAFNSKGPGTRDMLRRARLRNITILEINND